jgi:hypothetical protein
MLIAGATTINTSQMLAVRRIEVMHAAAPAWDKFLRVPALLPHLAATLSGGRGYSAWVHPFSLGD